MCGIGGFLERHPRSNPVALRGTVLKMVNTLYHRGPDDVGSWVHEGAGIALGHRRLSILDLSPDGHQPMACHCGRHVVTFNGEIYNYQALRHDLVQLGHRFRSSSDTEVLVESICHWGLDVAVGSFNGMFAFAVWDRHMRCLHLVRDRLGEKPLYYGWVGDTFLFGSELKALRAHPEFKAPLNRDAITLYVRHNYIPAPYSIYQGISKVEPATIVTVSADMRTTPTVRQYWSARTVAECGVIAPFQGSPGEAIAALDALLRDSIKLRMHADVPLGAFLSGGVDSSIVVALMQAQSHRPVQTYSIGFQEAEFNEAPYAESIARHLGTVHTEFYVRPEEALAVIPRLPLLYDEPFSDMSQIPTFLVAQLARQHVTVSLSGDGGDEFFGGYGRYFLTEKIWRNISWMPAPLRKLVAMALTSRSPEAWNRFFHSIAPLLSQIVKHESPGKKLHKLAEILAVDSPETMYHQLVTHWEHPSSLVLGAVELPTVLTDQQRWATLPTLMDRLMYFDAVTYLPGDILTKVDRATMGVSLEGRIPLLDHRIVEFAMQLPLSMKVRNGQGKWLLRQLLYNYVPPQLVDRPKMGFGVPMGQWLRGSLKEWAESLLDKKRLTDQGLFQVDPIQKKWQEHLSGKRNWQVYLWDILMFQAWFDNERVNEGSPAHEPSRKHVSVVGQAPPQRRP